MSFGILISGNQGQIQIDGERSVLREIVRGTYSRSGSLLSVTYPKPILSQQAPAIFVCPDGAAMFGLLNHAGGPGDWTGFSCSLVTTYPGMTGGATTGKYVACALIHPGSPERFGARVFDAAGNPVFDTGYRAARFLGGAQSFTWLDSQNYNGQILWRFREPWTYGADAYLLISGFRNYYDGVTYSGSVSVGFYAGTKPQVWATVHTPDSYVPILNWPMIAAAF